MAYDKPGWYSMTVDFTVATGSNGTTTLLKVPKGRSATLLDIQCVTTTLWTTVTTTGKVEIGHATDADAYGFINLIGAAGSVVIASEATAANGIIQKTYIPGGTVVLATFTGPTGGTPAGAGKIIVPFFID